VSAEAAVIAVAAAIYLVDCIVLLERGQALWSGAGLSFGSLHYQVRGKAVAMLNPLTPFIAVFRTLPLLAGASNVKAADAARALAPLSALGGLQLLLVLVALPYCLYRAPGWPFFAALVFAYLNALFLLLGIAWRFSRAGVSCRPLIALGFGWLACLPLSINSIRKAGLAFDIDSDSRKLIELIPAARRERARAELAAQIEEAMLELEDDDKRRSALALMKGELEADHGRL
jgi:hypothetical protein